MFIQKLKIDCFSELADSFIKISGGLLQLANSDNGHLDKFLSRVADTFEKARVSFQFIIGPNFDLKLYPQHVF